MKILLTHCDYIEYEAKKKAIESAEPIEEEKQRVEDCLVAFCSAEEGDDDTVVQKTAKEISSIAEQVHTKTIVVYPFVHLTQTPAKPAAALEIVKKIESLLRSSYETHRAPFGWYKSFSLRSKGHPLSELSREIKAGEVEIKRVTKKVGKPTVRSEAEVEQYSEHDHRRLGKELELFMFHETAPGIPYWLPNGLIVLNKLIEFWRAEHAKRGYKEIAAPLVNKSALWITSGHWEHYKENMFIANMGENEVYGVKAMNCPNAMIVFGSKTRSYKDLPLRLSDTDVLHRFELSGTLSGLLRVRAFRQDDSHNFITEDQIEEEYERILEIVQQFYGIFGMSYKLRLGTRPDSFMGDIETWNKAEAALKKILDSRVGKGKYLVTEKDGAFYGPKIDILMNDALGREWQMGTIQLDFQIPKKFDLKYVDSNGEEKTPVVIHRVVYGALERFIGILLEHCKGNLPMWLSPVQVKVLTLTDRNVDAAAKINKTFLENDIRSELDARNHTIQYKIREAELSKTPYILVVGDKEEQNNTLAVRERGEKVKFGVKLEDFLVKIKKEIENRK